MAVKAVEMVREIRDKYYEETKALSVEKQVEFIKKMKGCVYNGFA